MIKKQKTIVVVGDSGVYGWGDQDGGGWCERLRQSWMNSPGAPALYPLGVRGDGLEMVANRWQNEWGCRGELRRQVPGATIIAVGLNDTARIGRPDGRPQLSAEAYRFGLLQLLKKVTTQTKAMVIGLTAVDETVMPFADCLWYSNRMISIYEAQIEECCLELGIPFLPIHQKMLSNVDWLTWIEPDGIHLNSRGHQWIYQRVSTWSPLLEWAEMQPIENLIPLLG